MYNTKHGKRLLLVGEGWQASLPLKAYEKPQSSKTPAKENAFHLCFAA
jgi:hypothetical protein